MRKIFTVVVAIGVLAALAGPASSGARRARTYTATYDSTPTRIGGWFGSRYGVFFGDETRIDTKQRESTVKLTVVDDSGNAVAAAAWQNGDGDRVIFCTKSPPIAITGGKPLFVQQIIDVTPAAGVCETPAPTTTGTITAKLR